MPDGTRLFKQCDPSEAASAANALLVLVEDDIREGIHRGGDGFQLPLRVLRGG